MGEVRRFPGVSRFLLTGNRSVHNTRIERLWYDVSEGFGRKWKEFFYTLEHRHGLNASDHSHIWLLHKLFLPAINEDALNWAGLWNSHKIQLEGEQRSSPRQLFIRSSLTDGVHGLPPQDEELEDYTLYGVDWETMEGVQDPSEEGSRYHQPEWVNEVVCEPPNCPLEDEQVKRLSEDIAAVVGAGSNDMDWRRGIWVKAFELLSQLVGGAENDT